MNTGDFYNRTCLWFFSTVLILAVIKTREQFQYPYFSSSSLCILSCSSLSFCSRISLRFSARILAASAAELVPAAALESDRWKDKYRGWAHHFLCWPEATASVDVVTRGWVMTKLWCVITWSHDHHSSHATWKYKYQGSHTCFNIKFKDFSSTFQDQHGIIWDTDQS